MSFDKYKSCKGCPDRSINPNCHTYCEGYNYRVAKQKEIRRKRAESFIYNSYLADCVERLKKRKHKR